MKIQEPVKSTLPISRLLICTVIRQEEIAIFTLFLYRAAKRPASVVPGQIRPLSEYSRIACALGNTNPRFRIDNILRLDFDLPERTTQV